MKSRGDVLSELLDYAFGELFWISEAPNRNDTDDAALELARRARDACIYIECADPDRDVR